MPNPPPPLAAPTPGRRPRLVARAAALAVVAAGLALAVPDQRPGPATATAPDLRPAAAAPTTTRVGTFNLLGASHTRADGNKPGYASGWQRMGWALRLMREQSLEVVGLQELEVEQYDRFVRDGAQTWAIWPGRELERKALANSIIWRKDTWRAVRTRTVQVPYFKGNLRPMPYVLLEHRRTGARAWFYNSHNPADARGPAQQWRDEGYRIEAELTNRLRAANPEVPVLTLGDKNDTADFLCPVARATGGVSANGGHVASGVCRTPRRMRIDWIAGTPDVTFQTYEELKEGLVDQTSDHMLIMSRVSFRPPAPAAQHVVVVAVEGLRSATLRTAGTAGAPVIHGLVLRGAATWNARTAYESTDDLPNLVGMLTGRPVQTSLRGHGTWDTSSGATVHAAAGRYVSSVFDLVHNQGLSTAMLTTRKRHAVIDASWDADSGGADPYGTDDGTDKIDSYQRLRNDYRLTRATQAMMRAGAPSLTVLHFSALDKIGESQGYGSDAYRKALRVLDARLGRILAAMDAGGAEDTLVLLAGTHGGSRTGHADVTEPGNFKVPFVAAGPHVPAGVGVYGLNADLRFPRQARVGYDAAYQPFRNGYVPALVTAALGTRAVPGARLLKGRSVTVFGDSAG
jgi:hypothetical protein